MKCLWPILLVIATSASAKEIKTNEATMTNAPDWLKQPRVEKVTDHVQMILEWTTRRISVVWYTNQADYEKAQNMGPRALAVTKHDGGGSTIVLGPQVNDKNFDEVFGHELVHVIIFQKYKDAIPKWLEEGLANHIARAQKVDYKWLAQQPPPPDVHELAHPFSGDANQITYRYVASQAVAEMLEKKCDLQELIRLSVTRKMEDYIRTYCEIPDLNAAFRAWIKERAAREAKQPRSAQDLSPRNSWQSTAARS